MQNKVKKNRKEEIPVIFRSKYYLMHSAKIVLPPLRLIDVVESISSYCWSRERDFTTIKRALCSLEKVLSRQNIKVCISKHNIFPRSDNKIKLNHVQKYLTIATHIFNSLLHAYQYTTYTKRAPSSNRCLELVFEK